MHLILKNKKSDEKILIFRDDNNKKVITKINEKILYTLIYFKNTLSFKENTQEFFEMWVPNSSIVHDIILSHRNPNWKTDTLPDWNIGTLPKWYYILKYYECCDFLCIPFKKQLLFLIDNVPPEGYDLLVNTIDKIGYDKYNIWLMNKFLPKNYDLSKFPKELISKMMEYTHDYIIMDPFDNKLIIWNSLSLSPDAPQIKQIELSAPHNKYGDVYTNISISCDFMKIMTVTKKIVTLWNVNTGKILNFFHVIDEVKFVDFTNDSNYLVWVYTSHIGIVHLFQENNNKNICFTGYITGFSSSPNKKYCIVSYVCSNNINIEKIDIYESISAKHILTMRKNFNRPFIKNTAWVPKHICNIGNCFSSDSKKIVYQKRTYPYQIVELEPLANSYYYESCIFPTINFCEYPRNICFLTNTEFAHAVDGNIIICNNSNGRNISTIQISEYGIIQTFKCIYNYIVLIYLGNNVQQIWDLKKQILINSTLEFWIARKENLDLVLQLEQYL